MKTSLSSSVPCIIHDYRFFSYFFLSLAEQIKGIESVYFEYWHDIVCAVSDVLQHDVF